MDGIANDLRSVAEQQGALDDALKISELVATIRYVCHNDMRTDGMKTIDELAVLIDHYATALRASPSQVAPQPQAGEPVEKPYAYEFGRSNGDDTFSVVIERSLPAKPHPDWPVKPLYASPQPANPAQVTDAIRGIVEDALNSAIPEPWEVAEHATQRIRAAIGAGGQAVACPRCEGTGSMQSELRGFEHCTTCDGAGKVPTLSQPHPADERVEPTEGVSNKAVEGRKAYKAGQPKGSNPYPQGTARYWQWSSGWLDEQAFRPRPDERVVEALPRPDGVSMTCGTICLEYIDRDERDLAYDWLEAHGAGVAKEGR